MRYQLKVVASYVKAALVTSGKLKSTDGIYGLRFADNTEVLATGLTIKTLVASDSSVN